MKSEINRALKRALTAAALPFAATATNTELLRISLAHKKIGFSFTDREDALLAKLLSGAPADGGSAFPPATELPLTGETLPDGPAAYTFTLPAGKVLVFGVDGGPR